MALRNIDAFTNAKTYFSQNPSFCGKMRNKAILLTSCGTMLTKVIMVRNKIIKFCGVCG